MKTVLQPITNKILAKFEGSNGQICHKQRSAEWIINKAYAEGVDLSRVTDRTSGSWAIGLVRPVCKLGGRCNFVSVGEPDPFVRSYVEAHRGTFTVVTNEKRIPALQKLIDAGWWSPNQHENTHLIDAFADTLGEELLLDLQESEIPVSDVKFVVAAVGTGGTLGGVARRLRKAGGTLMAIGVEPSWSIVHGNGKSWIPPGLKIPGAGSTDEICAAFKYAWETEIDEIWPFPAWYAAFEMAESFRLGTLTCGMSGGLALAFARQVLTPICPDEKKILVIIPDSAWRYVQQLSMASTLFHEPLRHW